MTKPKGFTLIELLVVIAIIALLMSILIPSLSRVKKKTMDVVCQSNLRQWGTIFAMYFNDTGGRYGTQYAGAGNDPTVGIGWLQHLLPYYNEEKIRICPAASKPMQDISGANTSAKTPFAAWGLFKVTWAKNPLKGSYGINEWICDRDSTIYWCSLNSVKKPENIPLFLDSVWLDVWPWQNDTPPQYDGDLILGRGEMKFVCLNRHNQAVNCLYLDYSARKTGLKLLWKLKWNRSFSANPRLPDWPKWMRDFPDY